MFYLLDAKDQIIGTVDDTTASTPPSGYTISESSEFDLYPVQGLYYDRDSQTVKLKPEQPPNTYWDVDSNGWKSSIPEPTLDDMKLAKIAALSNDCKSTIESGFTSSALGAPHFYNSEPENQLNLIGAVLLNQSIAYTCTDENGVKQPIQHSAEQIKQVLSDGAAVKETAIARYHELVEQVNAASTIEDVEQVDW